MPKRLLITVATLSFASLALAAAPARVADTALGKVIVDGKGMTLSTFAKDGAGTSACNGPCAQNWPPLTAESGAKAAAGYSLATRDDGRQQWAYQGKPRYTWVKDSKPGDTSGDGVNQVWHVAKP